MEPPANPGRFKLLFTDGVATSVVPLVGGTQIISRPEISNSGLAAFVGGPSFNISTATIDGATATPLYPDVTTIYSRLTLDDLDRVAFYSATVSPDMVRGDGGPLELVQVWDGTLGGRLQMNNAGAVVWGGGPVPVQVRDGMTKKTVVDTPQAGYPSINDAGMVVYEHGSLIRLWDPTTEQTSTVLDFGDVLDGSTPFSGSLLGERALNDSNQIVFTATLLDGRTVLFRADPPASAVPLLSLSATAALGASLLSAGVTTLRRKRDS